MQTPTIPLTYKAVETRKIFDTLLAGNSCQLVGIGSSGKSNLLRFLLQDDTRAHYLGDAAAQWQLLYIDANKLLRADEWGVYELILHQLVLLLENDPAGAATAAVVEQLHQRACEPATEHLTLRYLDRALGQVINGLNSRVALLFDEFDELARTLPVRAFAGLRALRDEYKYRLVFITATRRPLDELRGDPGEIESFLELLQNNIVWLGCGTPVDARLMNERTAQRKGVTLSEEQQARLIELSGCHPGLQRGIFNPVLAGQTDPDTLAQEPAVQDECRQIWRSLPAVEQHALRALVATPKGSPPKPTLQRLHDKGLIDAAQQPFSPLFTRFVQQLPEETSRMEPDFARRVVWLDGRKIEDLTRGDFNCLYYLWLAKGEVRTTEAIQKYMDSEDQAAADEVNKQRGGKKIGRNAVEAAIKRLRQKVEPVPSDPRFIRTVHSAGYKLVVD